VQQRLQILETQLQAEHERELQRQQAEQQRLEEQRLQQELADRSRLLADALAQANELLRQLATGADDSPRRDYLRDALAFQQNLITSLVSARKDPAVPAEEVKRLVKRFVRAATAAFTFTETVGPSGKILQLRHEDGQPVPILLSAEAVDTMYLRHCRDHLIHIISSTDAPGQLCFIGNPGIGKSASFGADVLVTFHQRGHKVFYQRKMTQFVLLPDGDVKVYGSRETLYTAMSPWCTGARRWSAGTRGGSTAA